MTEPPHLTLYGRPGCCLCEDALKAVERVAKRTELLLTERNIEEDEGLLTAYLERIPVLTIDGREAFELFVDEDALEQALRAAGTPSPPQ